MSDESIRHFIDTAYGDLVKDRVERLRAEAVRISEHAREEKLDTTPQFVLNHMAWFKRWYYGGLATGYLMRATGVKRIDRHPGGST